MRRKPLKHLLMLAVGAAMVLAMGVPTLALVGPEPSAPDFSVEFTGTENFWSLPFDTAAGWDFGDREGYRCALVEYVQNGQVVALVEFERLAVPGQDENYLIMNDRGGVEHGDGSNPPQPSSLPEMYDPDHDGSPNISSKNGAQDICGAPPGAGPTEFEGIDHFPHGTAIDLYSGGSVAATINLFAPGTWPQSECIKPYWTPGNEPGEAYLWWDEDNPVKVGTNGPPCDYNGQPGGPIEAVAVARAFVHYIAPGLGVCTRDAEAGDWCRGVVTTPPPTTPPPTTSPPTTPPPTTPPAPCGKRGCTYTPPPKR